MRWGRASGAWRVSSGRGSATPYDTIAVSSYSDNAGHDSCTFEPTDSWRSVLLGTVAAGALFFGYARRAYAQHILPDSTCVASTALTIHCTSDVSTGVLLNIGGGFSQHRLSLTANIAPDPGIDGIRFTSHSYLTVNNNTTATPTNFSIQATGAASGIYVSSSLSTVTVNSTGDVSSAGGKGISAIGFLGAALMSNGTIEAYDKGLYAKTAHGNRPFLRGRAT
jgi:hypothetical protein